MIIKKHALLLVGSPRGQKSTSMSLGTYLLDQLNERGLETETVFIQRSLKSEKSCEELLGAVNTADVLILAFPLYVDSLPAPVIKVLELIRRHRKATESPKVQRLLAISNSGFPEAHQNETALAICRYFALEVGIEWVGGLALGGGEAIDGRLLQEVSGRARHAIKSRSLTAAALAKDEPVPTEAVNRMAKSIVPTRLYVMFGKRRWKKQGKRHGTEKKLYDRPHQDFVTSHVCM